ncbi:amino acid-binding ACT domain protein [Corynebacterium sp. A21]|uniref:amino acid-binding ACT domain protein n=1 Tax=Corynebacterium sp. A21 TaxID=3457318 RepID=UPI003FD3972C
MSFLIRVQLPDVPGSLGELAEAIGLVDGNIQSVDVVQTLPNETVVDDIVVHLPKTTMADSLITAIQTIDGAEVDSIRPFTGTIDRRGQIHMLSDIASQKHNIAKAMEKLVAVIPRSMTASWVIVLDTANSSRRVAASQAAPEDDGSAPEVDITKARVLDPDSESWIPDSWALLDSTLAATRLAGTNMVMVIGRTGGPNFLASEVEHLGALGKIVGTILT